MKPRLCVVISDLHSGSTYGLVPPDFYTKEGIQIGMNPIQKWLWSSWQDCWKWFYTLAKRDPWALVVNGDLTEGVHHGTTEVFSNNEGDHVIAAYKLLKEHGKKADSVYISEGTAVHSKDMEHSIAYHLGSSGVPIVRPKGEGGAWPMLELEIAGTLCRFNHHISTTSRPYLEASALSIHMGAERQEAARAGYRVPRVYGRAHRHKFGSFDDGYGVMFVTPPWQAITRFGRKVVPHAVPQVGMVVLDWRSVEDGGTPVLHKRLHTIKQVSPVSV